MIDQQPPQQDTEITLGTGKLLAIFLIAAIVCGAFFGMGYSVGKNSTPLDPMSGGVGIGVTVANNGSKPSAGTIAKPLPPDCATSSTGCVPLQASSSAGATPAVSPATVEGVERPADTAQATSETPGGTQVASNSSSNAVPPELAAKTSIMVQVAAVTKQEDAEALVSALRKKNYPVFLMPGSAVDRLFHVQVGPFAELKDAEAMKTKLVGDGYNAIVKK